MMNIEKIFSLKGLKSKAPTDRLGEVNDEGYFFTENDLNDIKKTHKKNRIKRLNTPCMLAIHALSKIITDPITEKDALIISHETLPGVIEEYIEDVFINVEYASPKKFPFISPNALSTPIAKEFGFSSYQINTSGIDGGGIQALTMAQTLLRNEEIENVYIVTVDFLSKIFYETYKVMGAYKYKCPTDMVTATRLSKNNDSYGAILKSDSWYSDDLLPYYKYAFDLKGMKEKLSQFIESYPISLISTMPESSNDALKREALIKEIIGPSPIDIMEFDDLKSICSGSVFENTNQFIKRLKTYPKGERYGVIPWQLPGGISGAYLIEAN